MSVSFGGRALPAPPEPAGGAYSAPLDPLAGFRGEGRREMGKVGMGKGRIGPPTFWLFLPPMSVILF